MHKPFLDEQPATCSGWQGTAFEVELPWMDGTHQWHPRSPGRLPDPVWNSTLVRIRGEFGEMPGLRLTQQQACALFGLPGSTSGWVLERLANDGFLVRTPHGVYMRREGAT